MAVEVATLNSSIRCRSVNTTLLLRCFWIKNCLTSFQKTFVAQHLRNRWEIVSISLWQKQHSSDCLRLIFFKKSLGAILRRKNVKWKVFNLVDAVQLKAIVYTSLTYTQSHTPTVVQGGEGRGWNPCPEFLMYCSISKRFYPKSKAFDLLNKIRYILWVLALLEACDVTNNGRYLKFYQELEIRLKLQEKVIFSAVHEK